MLAGGPLGLVRDGDIIRLCAETGQLQALVPAAEWAARTQATADMSDNQFGMGRELFEAARTNALTAEEGASTFGIVQHQSTGAAIVEGIAA